MMTDDLLRTLIPFMAGHDKLPKRTAGARRGSFSATDNHATSGSDSSDPGIGPAKPTKSRRRRKNQAARKMLETPLLRKLERESEGLLLLPGIHLRLIESGEVVPDIDSDLSQDSSARDVRVSGGASSTRRLRVGLHGTTLTTEGNYSKEVSSLVSGPLYAFQERKAALAELKMIIKAIGNISVDILYQPSATAPTKPHEVSKLRGHHAKTEEAIVSLSTIVPPKALQLMKDNCDAHLPNKIPVAWLQVLGFGRKSSDKAQATKEVKDQAKVLFEVLKICKPVKIKFDLSLIRNTEGGKAVYPDEDSDASSDDGSSSAFSSEIDAKGKLSRKRHGDKRRPIQKLAAAQRLMEENLDSGKVLVPMRITPFLLAGNKYFTSSEPLGKLVPIRSAVLPILELGPEIPISIQTGLHLPGLFAFARWAPETMVVHCWSDSLEDDTEKDRTGSRRGGRQGADLHAPLAEVLWDPAFALDDLLKGEAKGNDDGSNGTEIILVMNRPDDRLDFKHAIERLAGLHARRGFLQRSKDDAAELRKRDPENSERLALLKRSVLCIITSEGEGGGIVPVWNDEKDPLGRRHMDCTCGRDHSGAQGNHVRHASDGHDRQSTPAESDSDSVDESKKRPKRPWLGWGKKQPVG